MHPGPPTQEGWTRLDDECKIRSYYAFLMLKD
jgi:hypothetical protein